MQEDQTRRSAFSFYFGMLTEATAPGDGRGSASAEAGSRPTHVCTRQEQMEADARVLIGTSRYIFIIF